MNKELLIRIGGLLKIKLIRNNQTKRELNKLWGLIAEMKLESVVDVLERCKEKQHIDYYYQSLWRRSQDDFKVADCSKLGDILREATKR